MPTLPTHCPSCEQPLQVTRLDCASCGTHLEGTFELPPLLRLSPDDLAFVVDFVRASGSLKELARLRGQSYPTIRGRLDAVIARLAAGAGSAERQREEILAAIARGELTAQEGARRLKGMPR
jgi:hypothetical protein